MLLRRCITQHSLHIRKPAQTEKFFSPFQNNLESQGCCSILIYIDIDMQESPTNMNEMNLVPPPIQDNDERTLSINEWTNASTILPYSTTITSTKKEEKSCTTFKFLPKTNTRHSSST